MPDDLARVHAALDGLPAPSFTRDRRVRIASTKYDGSFHYEYDAYLIDVVGPAIRVWVDTGTYWRGYRGEGLTRHGETAIFFTDRWYNIRHMHPPDATMRGVRTLTYVNLALPARFDGDTLRWVDLDVDVIREADRVVIDDEDEFTEHIDSFGYPAELVAQVRQTTSEVTELLYRGAFPLDRAAHIPDVGPR